MHIQPRVMPLVTVKSSVSIGRCAFAYAFSLEWCGWLH